MMGMVWKKRDSTKSRLIGDAGKHWRQEEKEVAEEEMVRYHHQLDKHEFEQASGHSRGQVSLECVSPWIHKELDMT